MGHLADLETAVVHLKTYGLETRVVAIRGHNIICRVAEVLLTDHKLVQLHKDGKLNESGLKTIGLIPRQIYVH